jgi:hypothetical protein
MQMSSFVPFVELMPPLQRMRMIEPQILRSLLTYRDVCMPEESFNDGGASQ